MEILTGIVLDLEGGADLVVSIGIQTEIERRTVALGSVIIIGRQDLDNPPRRHVLRKDWSVILRDSTEKQFNYDLMM